MSDHWILDESGEAQPTDMMTWARWLQADRTRRVVSKTNVGDAEVSTVFLGLDHQYGDGPPLIFETLVFGGPLDQEMDRYSTRAEALAGHAEIVARCRTASDGEPE